MYENDISCTLMALLGGWLCEVTYTNPLFPPSFEKIFYSNQGGGGMAPCALSYSRDGGAARICQRGAKARVSHGREIFFSQNLCLKTTYSCTLDTFIRGSLCSGIDQFPTLVLFSFFSYNEFVSGKHFPFSLSFSFFFAF